MNDELKKALVDSLDLLKTGLEKSSDFVLEQAPMVVQEYIAYTRVMSTVQVVSGVLLFILTCITCRYWMRLTYRLATESSEALEVPVGIFGAAAHIFAFIGSIGLISNITTCIMAWTAPRVLILEKIAEIVK